MSDAMWAATIGGVFTLAGIVAPLMISQRRTRQRVKDTKERTWRQEIEGKIDTVTQKSEQTLGLLERMLGHMVHQDERQAKHEEQMNKVLTRLGRIEARQKQDHTRITKLEDDDESSRRSL